jgi:Rib/alpha/Esp surface antigen-like repeat protein
MARAPAAIGLSPQSVTVPALPVTTYDVTTSQVILENGMSRLFIKQNDTNPAMQFTLQDSDEQAVSLVGATARFLMRARGGSDVKTNAVASITDAAAGVVTYTPVAADTDTPGQYEAEVEITYSDGTKETFPSRGYISIIIQDDIA